jgi:hypothetical protein
MKECEQSGDPDRVVREKWYEFGGAAIVEETYERGSLLFVVTYNGVKKPLQNLHWFYEEAVPVTKEQAMRHLEAVRQRFAKHTKTEPPSDSAS